MLYSEIIAVCSQIHTKHINTLCWQNVEFLGSFAKLRKTTVRFAIRVSVRPSVRAYVRMGEFG
jgi:pantothenate kinase